MSYVVWKDSKLLSVLSTAHSGYRDKAADNITRRFSHDGRAPAAKHTIPAPTQAISYQQNYGGVDKADQMRSYFSVARKSNRWFFQVFFFLVDISRVNAYICYKDANCPPDQPNHAKFVMDLAEQLIDGYNEDGARRNRQDTSLTRQRTAHVLVNMGKKNPIACVGCLAKRRNLTDKQKGKRAHRSVFGCKACNKHMCSQCFRRLHQDPNCPSRIHDPSSSLSPTTSSQEDGDGSTVATGPEGTADQAD
jgi:hypothetical protein